MISEKMFGSILLGMGYRSQSLFYLFSQPNRIGWYWSKGSSKAHLNTNSTLCLCLWLTRAIQIKIDPNRGKVKSSKWTSAWEGVVEWYFKKSEVSFQKNVWKCHCCYSTCWKCVHIALQLYHICFILFIKKVSYSPNCVLLFLHLLSICWNSRFPLISTRTYNSRSALFLLVISNFEESSGPVHTMYSGCIAC